MPPISPVSSSPSSSPPPPYCSEDVNSHRSPPPIGSDPPPSYSPPPPYSSPSTEYLRTEAQIASIPAFIESSRLQPPPPEVRNFFSNVRRMFLITDQDSCCVRIARFAGFAALSGAAFSGLGAAAGALFGLIPGIGSIVTTTGSGAVAAGVAGTAIGGLLSCTEYCTNPERDNNTGFTEDDGSWEMEDVEGATGVTIPNYEESSSNVQVNVGIDGSTAVEMESRFDNPGFEGEDESYDGMVAAGALPV